MDRQAQNAKPRRHRPPVWWGAVLSLAIAGAAVMLQASRAYQPHTLHDRFQLPAFDAYVYVAMAERPSVFTVAPWGYRLLGPSLAGALPHAGPVLGLRVLTWVTIVASGVLLFLLLRRLGNGHRASLLGVGLFGLSGPVAEAMRNPFVPEPLVLLVLVSFLLAVEAGAGLAVLALIAVVGALTKEILLALLPLLLVAARRDSRGLAAWARAGLAAVPALVATAGLRWWWTPHLGGGDVPTRPGAVLHALGLIASSWQSWWLPALVTGLVPLALLGALRREARPFLRRYGYLLLVYAALPFMAAVYVGTDERPAMFFSGDIPRLTLHLLPFLIPLVLIALDRVLPHRGPPTVVATRTPRLVRPVAALLAAALALVPFTLLDRYRRFDLSTVRDGLLVLATTRGSWRVAKSIESGRRVIFGPEQSWVPGRDIAPLMEHMRWFLRDGWGRDPQYGSRDIMLQGSEGRILLPCLAPRELRLSFQLVADEHERLLVRLNGQALGTVDAGRRPKRTTLHAPRAAVFRGDNVLTLERSGTSRRGPRLVRLAVRRAARSPGEAEGDGVAAADRDSETGVRGGWPIQHRGRTVESLPKTDRASRLAVQRVVSGSRSQWE